MALLASPTPVVNHQIDVNRGVERYLQVREQSNLSKRIKELKKIIRFYGLEDRLDVDNRSRLGFSDHTDSAQANIEPDIDEK